MRAIAIVGAGVWAACASGDARLRPETLATLTRSLPDYAPIPDPRTRLDIGVRGLAGGMTAGGWHAIDGELAASVGVRRDALSVRVEGEAGGGAGLETGGHGDDAFPGGGGVDARVLRAGAAARYSLWASSEGVCYWCGKHSPATRLERFDLWIEGGAGREWLSSDRAAAARDDLELGAGFEVGPRTPTHHWAIEMGLRMLLARSPDSGRIDHPLVFVLGVDFGS